MKLIPMSYQIDEDFNPIRELKRIERAARNCYKSEAKITDDSYIDLIGKLVRNKHWAMFRHGSMSVKFVFNRGCSHEIVRHGLANFAQESTRWINYTSAKQDGECKFAYTKPFLANPDKSFSIWLNHMVASEKAYNAMIEAGEKPQIARDVLPIGTKTEIVVSAYFEEWRHIFSKRVGKEVHPQLRFIMVKLMDELDSKIPYVFADIFHRPDVQEYLRSEQYTTILNTYDKI